MPSQRRSHANSHTVSFRISGNSLFYKTSLMSQFSIFKFSALTNFHLSFYRVLTSGFQLPQELRKGSIVLHSAKMFSNLLHCIALHCTALHTIVLCFW